MDNTALFNLSYGVYVVTTWGEGKATGCTANSAMQITATPATVAVSINHDNYTNKCIKDSGVFAVNILGELVTDSTKKNLEMRVEAENGATLGKFELAKMAKEQNLDAIHDTVHEMARDEARHGKAFEGLLKRYFG